MAATGSPVYDAPAAPSPAGRKKRYRVRTTDSRHDQPIAPNGLAALSAPQRINQAWVADITYIPTAEGWLYLAVLMDLL